MLITIIGLILTWLPTAFAQTKKPLSNADNLEMTKQGFESHVIVTAIQTSEKDFDVSTHAFVDLKNSGVAQPALEAMLAAHGGKLSGSSDAAHRAVSAEGPAPGESSNAVCGNSRGCMLRETTQVPLKFAADVNSKPAQIGDPVEFVLDEDIKVSDVGVVMKGGMRSRPCPRRRKRGVGKTG